MNQVIRRFATLDALASAAAESVVRAASEAVQQRGRCTMALAGGSTPRPLYQLLADEGRLREAMPWLYLHIFWGDERHVAPTHPDSNYAMARAALLDRVPLVVENVHRIRAEWQDADRVAADYEATLRLAFGLQPGQVPAFDLILLGMGSEGHTASIFPGSPAILDVGLVAAPWVEKLEAHRITLTGRVLAAARSVMVLVSGPEKAPALRAVLEGPDDRDRFPAQLLRECAGEVQWLIDEAASAQLSRS